MKAQCTWGDGPDILISLEGTPLMLYENPSQFDRYTHGIVFNGSFDLNLKEAIQLRNELNSAIDMVIDIENSLFKI